MDRVQPGYVQLVLHDDENTPQDFVVGLLRSVFSLSPADAFEVMIIVEKRGKAVCGTYPPAVAEALLQAAQERIRASGHQLVMTAQAGDDIGSDRCKLCSEFSEDPLRLVGKAALVCDDCMLATAEKLGAITEQSGSTLPVPRLNGISPVSLGIGWSQRRGSFPGTCAPTFRRRWTSCSPSSASGSSAFRNATATRPSPSPR